MPRLQDKIILITGAARGQGAAEARLFVREGARVIITDIFETPGRRLAEELGPEAAIFLRHDVASEADWQRAVDAASDLGGLHGLILVSDESRYITGAEVAIDGGAAL
jgi:3alpha(or 20beta)-hydroxysteroid dehydrogenase